MDQLIGAKWDDTENRFRYYGIYDNISRYIYIKAAEAVAEYLPHREKPKDTKGLIKNLRLKENGRYYWHWDPRFLVRKQEHEYLDLNEIQRTVANRVTVPTLLIRGALSDVVTEKNVFEFLSAIPHAEFEEINEAAHMVAGDRNDIFVKAAVKFLKKVIST